MVTDGDGLVQSARLDRKNQYAVPVFSIDNLVCCPRIPAVKPPEETSFGHPAWPNGPVGYCWGQLLKEGSLVSDSPKGAIRFGIPTHVAGYLFPDLNPERKLKERMSRKKRRCPINFRFNV